MRAARMAAELPEREGGAAAEILRHVDAVTHRQITATACAGAAQRQRLSGADGNRLPAGDRFAIELCIAVRAGEREDSVAVKAQRRPLKREFKPGGLRRVTDDAVRQTESVIVHRPGRRHADIPVAQTARIILYAAPGAWLQHFDGVRVVAHFIQQARPHGGVFKRLQTDNLAQIIEISGDAVQARGVERLAQFRQRLRAVIAVNDDFGDHRIVKRADFRTGADPAIDPHAVREMHVGKLPRRRLKVFQRIFGIETHFNRRALRRFCEPRPVQRLARGHIDHALDKIEPRHGLGYRVLHLKAGVDLQKPEAIAPGVVDKLNGACAAIIDRFAKRHRGGV
ncbi:hypothetical protein BN128_959 [Cronobacter sakazakii 696]|nr:hypothetical protein BN128_959 [Cronobacter sakazakii 696]